MLALDHEDPKVPLANAKQFLARVEQQAGRRAVLYSGFLIKQQLGNGHDAFLAQHRLWLSHFSSNPVCPRNWEKPWTIQFTGDGVGPGPHQVPGIVIEGGIDLNHYGRSCPPENSGSQETLRWREMDSNLRHPNRSVPFSRPFFISPSASSAL